MMKYTQITFQLIGKLFLFIALAGCQQNDKYTALLLQADSIMNVRPDSALALLNSIQFPQEMKTADRALYSLLFTQAEQKNRILHTNDSLIRIAVDYYKDKDDKEQETKAYYYLGCVYQDIGDIVGATDAFLKALNINPQVINDTEILTMIYENLAECYQSQGFYDKAMEMYKAMWTQIGEHFADRSYKLIFESANEELGDKLNDKEITGSSGVLSENECYETANEINSEFVKLIRSLGGRNADRFLLIAGYNTDITKTCDDRFQMPEDTADSKLLLSVHYYTPWDYCGTDGDNQWGSPQDYDEQNGLFEKLSKFSKQGYGVVIGEYAVMLKNGGIKQDTDKFYDNLLDNCDLYDYCPVLWDCSNFYKRITNTISDETLAELFSSRAVANEAGKSTEEIKAAAKEKIESTRKTAE